MRRYKGRAAYQFFDETDPFSDSGLVRIKPVVE
jgi:hypothetical protein